MKCSDDFKRLLSKACDFMRLEDEVKTLDEVDDVFRYKGAMTKIQT